MHHDDSGGFRDAFDHAQRVRERNALEYEAGTSSRQRDREADERHPPPRDPERH
ncbi:hypothetical protein [Litchfieldella rifensis]|uniref:Uncharacterized protein n=1 Tax=Litchfieldella rifensis TaxID=762643 RepID=A0ABV7LNN2_9GAMM